MDVLLLAAQLALMLAAGKACAWAARAVGLPGIVGEVVAGVLLGPTALHALPAYAAHADHAATGRAALGLLGLLGVLLVLFESGLDASLGAVRRTAKAAARVGVLGVVLSLAGCAAASWLAAQWAGEAWLATPAASARPAVLHLFVGATFCATSVAVTVRTLRDVGLARSATSTVVLGAAVLDDVLGLVVLAAATGLAAGRLDALGIARVSLVACALLVGAVAAAPWISGRVERLRAATATLGAAALAWLAAVCGLCWAAGVNPLVGAFAAGLALSAGEHGARLARALRPAAGLVACVFFVGLGASVDLGAAVAAGWPIVGAGVLLVGVGTAAKVASGLGAGAVAPGLVVGAAMVPRGEVGFVFVAAGAGILGASQQAVVLAAVLATTVLGPLLVRLVARQGDRAATGH